ncbi:MAG: DUF5008 domain-containing protein [Sphingobacteriaceae bacterium]
MKFRYFSLIMVLLIALFSSCKEKDTVFDDPYSGGVAPLGIKVDPQQIPSPAAGIAGTTVTIAVQGLMPHKDKLSFLFNGQTADIVEITDSEIKVKVPGKASSGITTFEVDGQLVFGPKFTVLGLVNLDPTFKAINGTNDMINKAVQVTGGNWFLLGDFTNYDNKGVVKAINRIARIQPNGTLDRSLQSATGSNGTLSDMAILNGQYYIAGGFSGYAQRGDGINNITRIATTGVIDTVFETTYTGRLKFATAFNGGTDGSIQSVYAYQNKIIATGDFRYYLSRRYNQPSKMLKDSTIVDSVDVRQLVRFNRDGSLDKTWRFDPEATGYKGLKGKSLPGGTGRLSSIMHSDGKILAYGQFTKFDDAAAGYIVRLNADGTIDNSFNVGTGADYYINNVNYNDITKKYTVVGVFKNFNGKPAVSMLLLNYDGSIDETFKAKVFTGGFPSYAKQLSDGLIVVGGGFKTYDTVNRQGFCILDTKGELADGYNTIGNLLGYIADVKETKSEDDKRALLIVGRFFVFDNQPAYNIVRVTME